jgi:hypothetical protein
MKKRKDFVEVVESSSQKTSRPDIFGFLKEEPKQEPIVEEVREPVEYKFNFKETVKEERKVSRRNVFDILVEKPAEEPVALVEEPQPLTISQVEVPETVEEKFSQSDVDGLEKFADRILKKYGIDVEFTRHFVDRLNDPRNKPEIKVAELQRFFKKIQKNKGKDIRQNPDVEVVLKDLASDINLPVVINYKDGEFEVVNKTVMRKKDFKTPDKVIKYEEVEETVEEVVEEPTEEIVEEEPVAEEEQTVISKSVEYLHNNKEEVVEKTEYDLIREELNTLKRTIATQFGKMSYGSGEVNLQFLDDVERDTAKVDGKFLKYSASTGKWIGADASGDAGGGGISWQAVKTSNFNATAGEGYFIDTSGGAVTATLPASPTLGDEVSFIDYAATADTNNITIARNGSNILAAAEDLTVSTERAGFTLVFTDSTQGWILKDK